jgi:hypothetical protein
MRVTPLQDPLATSLAVVCLFWISEEGAAATSAAKSAPERMEPFMVKEGIVMSVKNKILGEVKDLAVLQTWH